MDFVRFDNEKNNALGFLQYSSYLIRGSGNYPQPQPIPKAGYYWPNFEGNEREIAGKIFLEWQLDKPIVPIIFYRALVQAGNTAPINALIKQLKSSSLNPLPIFVSSLRDIASSRFVETALKTSRPTIIINACAFSVSTPGYLYR